ncbi:ABC transporter permease [Thermus scotoductus]|uniref:ABC transporter permease n=2 Tax=Thermus TaxID=270 RepID=A0A430REW8_THESC|nr:ABC transporter permease [Thermus scotoductus]RTH06074.1 ABC transporter permease [Thermus scotoductus]
MPGSSRVIRWLAHGGLWLFSLVFLLPLLWTLRSALLPEGLAYALPPAFGPWTLENFRNVLEGPFGKAFRNSFLVAISVVLLGLPLAAGLGYALARYRVGGHGLRFAVLATQMLPPIVLALPLFALMRLFGLSGTLWALVLSYLAFALPFMAWLLLGFFQNLPRELEEAAYVDGATPFQVFFRVVLPLATPGLFAAGILGFLLSWNEFLFALLLSGRDTQTVPVALSTFVTQRGVLFAQVAAGVVLSVLPVALLARMVDRYLVEGLTLGAVK